MEKHIIFTLTEEQAAKAEAWMEERKQYAGAVGGQFKFSFTPNGVGTAQEVIDTVTGEALDLTDYDLW